MDLAARDRLEMEFINTKLRTQIALKSAPANEVPYGLLLGNEVAVYRENGHWDGSFLFL